MNNIQEKNHILNETNQHATKHKFFFYRRTLYLNCGTKLKWITTQYCDVQLTCATFKAVSNVFYPANSQYDLGTTREREYGSAELFERREFTLVWPIL